MKTQACWLQIIYAIVILNLSACGSSTGSSEANSSSNSVTSNSVTLDDTATVPVLSGTSNTTTSLMVHNNTNQAVSGINYSSSDSNFTINNASDCATIAANSECSLQFTTPSLNTNFTSGSSVITLQYLVGAMPTKFSQLVNYATVNTANGNGVNLSTGNVSSFGASNEGFATIYLYGSGDNSSVINNVEDPALVNFVNSYNNTLADNQVEAVEIDSTAINPESGNIVVSSSEDGDPETNAATVNVLADITNLNIGDVIPVDLENTTTGHAYIENTSSYPATISSIYYGNGLLNAAGNNSCVDGQALSAGDYCVVYFSITSPNGVGSSSIVVNYTGNNATQSTSQTVSWYSENAALTIESIANINTLLAESGSTTVTNTGTSDALINSITYDTGLVSGSGANACYNSEILAPNQTCGLYFNISSESGTANVWVNYSGGESNLATTTISWSSSTGATISIPSTTPLNQFAPTTTETINNNGSTPAVIIAWYIGDNYISQTSGGDQCYINEILQPGSSCNMYLQNNDNGAGLSGITNVGIYYNGGTTPDTTATQQVCWDYQFVVQSCS